MTELADAVDTVDDDDRSRLLAAALDPLAGQAFFAPEAHEGFAALGFAPSPGRVTDEAMSALWGDVEVPDPPSYFCARASALGPVPGEVVSAVLGVFAPAVVVPSVAHGWSLTDAATARRAHVDGAVAQLRRVLDPSPDDCAHTADLLAAAADALPVQGRPLFAALRAQPEPDDPLVRLWLRAEQLREFRGDANVAAWTSAGVDAVEIGLLTEGCQGTPLGSYWITKGWRPADIDAGAERLRERGLIDAETVTADGRRLREQIERTTDLACRPAVEQLGSDLVDVVARCERWSALLRDAGAYCPGSPQDAFLPAAV